MKPFAWYDHFNDEFIRTEGVALRALAGGNEVTPLYIDGQTPDRRFTAAVAALQRLAYHIGTSADNETRKIATTSAAQDAVQYADALLAELDK